MLTNFSPATLPSDMPAGVGRALGRVLVVDDAGAQRDAVARALRAEGFDVVEATCGEEALDAARRTPPEAVVLDVCRPDSRGVEICRRLKAEAPGLLPVLHLSSAGTSSEDRARGLDAGADSYLAYPFDPNELCAAVSALVRLERQHAERMADASANSALHDALDALADHVALLGPGGEVIAVNRAWTDFASANGYRPADRGLGKNYFEVCDRAAGPGSDDAHAAALGIRRVLAGETNSFELEYPCHSLAARRWFRMVVRRVTNPGPVAAVVIHTDRTRARIAARAEAIALAAAEADRRRLQATLEALPVGVWLSDADGRVTHSNPAAAQLWGGAGPRLQTVEDYVVYHGWWPETGAPIEARDWPMARTLRTGATITGEIAEIERFDGAHGYTLNSSAPILDREGRTTGGVAVSIDITEHQAAARERERLVASLESERASLVAIFQEAPAFLAVLRGPEYVFERINPAYLQLVGHRESVGKRLLEALPEIREQGFIELLDRVRTTGEPFVGRHLPVRLARVAGAPLETRYVDMVYQRLADSHGEHSIVAHGVDVTDQVLATAALRQTEQRLRDQFAKLPVPTFLWELHGDDFILVEWNEAAKGSIAHGQDAPTGRTRRELFPGTELIDSELRRSLRENVVVRRKVEFDAGPPVGRRLFELTIGPQQPDRVLVHAVDTTEQAELEEQLRQAQKMEAVGRLAGGVAHDFNNLLTVIGAHSEFLLETLDSGDARHEDAEAIHKAGIRAAGLTRQLLAFSRKQILKSARLDLNAIVKETRKMLARLLGDDIAIVSELADDLGHVVADPSQIDQVLMNLAVNARDAMADGGTLTITTRNVTVAADMPATRRALPAGEYALLEVRDTGAGMEAATLARLFEPFFTTKGQGKGTGLGLATVYGIVKQSSGHILVESVPAQGTTFQVYLPLVQSGEEAGERFGVQKVVAPGVETLLVVEDEPAVREIARRVLSRQGYAVLEASNGLEALAVAAAFAGTIHLVLSDAVMPGMGGAEAVRRLQEQRPGLKAVFTSGYTDDEIMRRGIISSAVPFVQKPFAPAELARVVRATLDG